MTDNNEQVTDEMLHAFMDASNAKELGESFFALAREYAKLMTLGGLMDPDDWGHKITIVMCGLTEITHRLEKVYVANCDPDRLRETAKTFHPAGFEMIWPDCFFTNDHTNCPHSEP